MRRKGFTVIEVVLVLAIAGLVFVMVFIAFPALQRNQRNAQRRQDVTAVATALSNYKANGVDFYGLFGATPFRISSCSADAVENIGSLNININGTSYQPFACRIVREYFNDNSDSSLTSNEKNEFEDPDGNPYTLYIASRVLGGSDADKLVSKMRGDADSFDKHAIVVTFFSECDNSESDNGNVKNLYVSSDSDDAHREKFRKYTVRYRLESDEIYCMNAEL